MFQVFSKTLFPLVFLFLVGCTSVPYSKSTPVPADRLTAFQFEKIENKAEVYVTRDWAMAGGACRIALYIDGVIAGTFDNGNGAKFYLKPGRASFSVGPDGKENFLCKGNPHSENYYVELEPNSKRNLRIHVDILGKFQVHSAD